MKTVLMIAASPRRDSNSEHLAEAFAKGARDAGHEVKQIRLADRTIGFCKGCLACQKTRRCIIHDDVESLLDQMKTADVLAFATPIYFYEMCGQMKTLLDRTNPLFSSTYAFRDIYLLATAADEDEQAMDGAVKGLQGWIACFEKTRLAGVVRGLGVTQPGAIRHNAAALGAAYAMGNKA